MSQRPSSRPRSASAAPQALGEFPTPDESLCGLLKALPDAMVLVDSRGRILWLNTRAEALFGYGRAELLQEGLTKLIPERFRDRHGGYVDGYFASLRVRPMESGLELFALHKNGYELPVDVSLSPIESAMGTLVLVAVRDVSAGRALQEALRGQAQIMEQIPDALFRVDGDGRVRSWNRGAERLFGAPAREMLGRHICRLVLPDDSERVRRELAAVLGGRPKGELEVQMWCGSDGDFVAYLALSPFVDDTGALSGCIGYAKDISERKTGQTALRVRERQHAAVAALGRDALAGLELDILFDEAVGQLARVLEVEYAKVLELLPRERGALLRAGVGWREGLLGQAVVHTGLESQAGYTLLSEMPVVVRDLRTETRFSGPELLVDHGVVSGMSVIIHGRERAFGVLGVHSASERAFSEYDVSFLQSVANVLADAIERKRFEERIERRTRQLKRTNKRLRREVRERKQNEEMLRRQAQIIDQIHDSVVATNLDGDVTSWNTGAERLFGYTSKEALGRHISFVYPADQHAFLEREVVGPLKDKGTHEVEVCMRKKSGETIDCHLSLSMLHDARGERIGMIGYSMDITEHKRAEAKLQDYAERLQTLSQRLLQAKEDENRRIARELHDEIGQALTAVQIGLQRLQQSRDTSRLGESIAIVERILQQVRELSLDLHPATLDDLGLVAALRWYVKRQAQHAAVRAVFHADPLEERPGREVETACFRIAQEAVTNAIRHAGAHTLRVSLQQTGGWLRLSVSDDGEGFDAADVDARTPRGSMGLMSMQERAALIGGRVEVASARGRGTQVQGWFPLNGAAERSPGTAGEGRHA
jgi:PAS domain S-box-containing protein